jgi:ribosomal protein S18 acetylase RimI-like enzyme
MLILESISDGNLSDVADVHLEAFAGYMNASIGRGYVVRFLRWFARRPGAIALAALVDGSVVGYVVGAPIGYERSLSRDLFWTVARATAVRPWLFLRSAFRRRLLLRAKRLVTTTPAAQDHVPDLPEPVMSLVGIGVSAAGRGAGVGRALMQEFEDRCRVERMKAMRLSVYATNQRARSLYERAGWTLFVPEGQADAVYYYRLVEGSPSEEHGAAG